MKPLIDETEFDTADNLILDVANAIGFAAIEGNKTEIEYELERGADGSTHYVRITVQPITRDEFENRRDQHTN